MRWSRGYIFISTVGVAGTTFYLFRNQVQELSRTEAVYEVLIIILSDDDRYGAMVA